MVVAEHYKLNDLLFRQKGCQQIVQLLGEYLMLYQDYQEWRKDLAQQFPVSQYLSEDLESKLREKWKGGDRRFSTSDNAEIITVLLKSCWTNHLLRRQNEFIERLKVEPINHHFENLSECPLRDHFGEILIISKEHELTPEFSRINNTALKLERKEKELSKDEKIWDKQSWLKGKLGEVAFKYQFSDLLSEVDHEFNPDGGDGGVDFELKGKPQVKIQVKTRFLVNTNAENIKWFFKKSEVEKNDVFLCLLLLTPYEDNDYRVIFAGFTTKLRLKSPPKKYNEDGEIPVTLEDLGHCSGIRDHLSYLEYNSLDFILCDLSAESYYQKALTLNQPDNSKESLLFHNRLLISLYSKAIEIEPENSGLYNRRALVYKAIGDNPGALADFNYALEIDPQFIQGYMNRALVYQDLENYKSAIEDYTRVIASFHKREQYFSVDNIETERVDKVAIHHFENNTANIFYAHYERALCYEGVSDFARAVKDLKDAEKYFNFCTNSFYQLRDLYYKRAIFLFNQGELNEAIQDCNRVISLNDNNGKAYGLRGMCYANLKNDKAAFDDFTICRQKGALDGIFALQLGKLWWSLENYSEAILVLAYALNREQSSGLAMHNFEFHVFFYRADSYLWILQDDNWSQSEVDTLADYCLENCQNALKYVSDDDFFETNDSRNMVAKLLYMKGLCSKNTQEMIDSLGEARSRAESPELIQAIDEQLKNS